MSLSQFVREGTDSFERGSIETALSLGVRPQWQGKRVMPLRYHVDFYFEFPEQMNINNSTLPIEEFYRHTHSLVRFREPKLSFREFIYGSQGRQPIVERIQDYLSSMLEGEAIAAPNESRAQAMAFGCSYYSYCQRKIERHLRNLAKSKDLTKASYYCDKLLFYLRRMAEILDSWRQLASRLDECPQNFMQKLQADILITDEFCSYVFRDALLKFATSLAEFKRLGEYNQLRSALHQMIETERKYFKDQGYIWLSESDSPLQVEEYLYRKNQIKRKVLGSLFLKFERRPIHSIQKQLGAMLAAAFAGAFAVIVSVVVGYQAFTQIDSLLSAQVSLLVLTFTVSYVAKDRIKEWGRSAFRSGIFTEVPDASHKIYYKSLGLDEGERTFGNIFEKARYIDHDDLPDSLRIKSDKLGVLRPGGKVLHYTKRIELARDLSRQLSEKMKRFQDVMRFNILPALVALGEPEKNGYLAYFEDAYIMPVAKIHKILFHVHVQPELRSRERIKPYVASYFIVVNKRGILRIERLQDSQQEVGSA